ncbi:MAG: anthranilate synthase component I family protein [Cryomorphaceae bacterium]|nr:anthranilate synthase component I family protein [Cryomorphaceae bacterium]
MEKIIPNTRKRISVSLGKCDKFSDILQIIAGIPTTEYLSVLTGSKAPYSEYNLLIGWGARAVREGLDHLPSLNDDWWFGHIPYDTHSHYTGLVSRHTPFVDFPSITFFCPVWVVALKDDELTLHCPQEEKQEALRWWKSVKSNTKIPDSNPIQLQATISRDDYLQATAQLKSHLKRGDIYEINFCQYFIGEGVLSPNPIHDFARWMNFTEAPFSAYYKCGNHHLLCASPERFLCKRGDDIIAQPIKGTALRGLDIASDEMAKKQLLESEKERAENVMIVDLMRNDLSQLATVNSVQVTELFGIYSFSQVHQMISTIKATLRKNLTFREIIEATFPMGSMTGAPKRSAIKLIDVYEDHQREMFSGSLGYIAPNGDFDFNVVIRSLQHNANKNVSLAGVGSALTYLADTEKEYEECLWKLTTIQKIWSP